jgi:hypothetical protein
VFAFTTAAIEVEALNTVALVFEFILEVLPVTSL